MYISNLLSKCYAFSVLIKTIYIMSDVYFLFKKEY